VKTKSGADTLLKHCCICTKEVTAMLVNSHCHSSGACKPKPKIMLILLLPVPHAGDLGMPHLLLQLENAVHESLRCWWAPWHVNIHWHNPVAPSRNRITVMIVSTSICARAHRNNPSRIWHLIVNLSQSRCHFVGQCSSNNHDIRLSWRGTENDSESVLIVSWCGEMHHFNGAACETESHRPQGTLSCPIRDLIECGQCVLSEALLSLLTW